MNKKILFRIWNKKEKRMLEDIHICPQYGWLVMSDNDALSEICGRVPEDDLIWMQYTGLTDKNGKKIFEGDILKSYYDKPGIVKWNNEIGAFQIKEIPSQTMKRSYQMEVVGNIFDKEVK